MINSKLDIRDLEEKDINLISDYWLNSDIDYLQSLGVDLKKIPDRIAFSKMLKNQLITPITARQSHALIWEYEGKAIGHCNVNQIEFGNHAYMHLHIWYSEYRKMGLGNELVRKSVSKFFTDLALEKLYCEPYSENPSPNKTLEKIGFKFEKTYKTIPGSINFEQKVNRWVLTRKNFTSKYNGL